MRDTIYANYYTNFEQGEKVIAFNWFSKKYPFDHGTYIEKYSPDKELLEDEMCRKTETREMCTYNIGVYKVKGFSPNFAIICQWERQDGRIRNKKE